MQMTGICLVEQRLTLEIILMVSLFYDHLQFIIIIYYHQHRTFMLEQRTLVLADLSSAYMPGKGCNAVKRIRRFGSKTI